MCQSVGRHAGIPIQDFTFKQYSAELQAAWNSLDSWLKGRQNDNLSLSKSEMPDDIVSAYNLIKETPIPGFEGHTGKDSCYIVNFDSMLVD